MSGKLFKIFLIILLLEAFLIAYSFFSPKINLPFLNDKDIEIKFIELDDLMDFSYNKVNLVADSLIAGYLKKDSVQQKDSTKIKNILKNREIVAGILENKSESDTAKKAVKPKTDVKLPFEEPTNNLIALINQEHNGKCALDAFFNALTHHKDTSILRIAHYGDSQLEGDRVTSYIRRRFQEKFGGSGIGFVPCTDITSHVNLRRYESSNWKRYTVFKNKYKNGNYGVSGTVFRFTNNNYKQNPWLKFDMYKFVSYQSISILYGNALTECIVNTYNLNKEKICSDTLPITKSFTIQKLKVPSSQRSVKFEFIADNSPDFYGFLIEGENGVQVDNYAIRGHSGTGLMDIDSDYLAKQIKLLNTRLIIFQFGANVVPYITSNNKCKQLEEKYYELFMKFKAAAPNASILVVGAGDMATYIHGKFQSYPFLPKIRDAQKNAALRAGCAFWDLFEVMGGMNSIIAWTNKGLTAKDGHLYDKGRRIIAKELFDDLMDEYNTYLLKQQQLISDAEGNQ